MTGTTKGTLTFQGSAGSAATGLADGEMIIAAGFSGTSLTNLKGEAMFKFYTTANHTTLKSVVATNADTDYVAGSNAESGS